MIFGLQFFHAVICERSSLPASIGWMQSPPYHFSYYDRRFAMEEVKQRCLEAAGDSLFYSGKRYKIPWEDLLYLVGMVIYGGMFNKLI